MNIFVKLGDNAHSFSDPISGFVIVKGEVLVLTDAHQKSLKIKNALKGGHLVRSTKSEFDTSKQILGLKQKTVVDNSNEKELRELLRVEREKNKSLEETIEKLSEKKEITEPEKSEETDFSSMSDEELVKYYSETFDVSDKQIKAFTKLSKEDKVSELEKLDE